MTRQLPKDVLQHTLDVFVSCGSIAIEAAKRLNIPPATFHSRMRTIRMMGLKPTIEDPNDPAQLKSQIRRLTDALKQSEEERLNHTVIKHKIIQLTRSVDETDIPKWIRKSDDSHSKPGVPTLMVSDLHWGEVVDGKQINGVNRYNMEIARERLTYLAERTLHLCEIISPKMEYPGIVVPLGGDMVSGNIHDELTATNEVNSMPVILDLFEALSSMIKFFRSKFNRVFLPCVTGNHGRDTRKIWAKDRHHTSFDWLLYCFLAKRFADDQNITFLIPDGTDAYYKIYDHTYLLTHGDQFRGGDGVIGPLGPIIRGDHRKRSRNSQINMSYDTMLMGHWHNYMHLNRLIVNSSLKGYDEYAWSANFPYEPAQQALWLTHQKYRITYRMPVLVDKFRETRVQPWVSVGE